MLPFFVGQTRFFFLHVTKSPVKCGTPPSLPADFNQRVSRTFSDIEDGTGRSRCQPRINIQTSNSPSMLPGLLAIYDWNILEWQHHILETILLVLGRFVPMESMDVQLSGEHKQSAWLHQVILQVRNPQLPLITAKTAEAVPFALHGEAHRLQLRGTRLSEFVQKREIYPSYGHVSG